jgi:hypothetical protein
MLAILMCIIAVLPICVCLFLFAKFLNQVEFERWERTLASYMLPMTIFSIILFALMFLTAVPIYAHSKGHALVSGIGWALLGPIGLLAVALMSDRTAPKPPPPLGPPS